MDELPLVIIAGLEGNDVAALTPLQSALAPYVPQIETALWTLWAGTLAFVALKYVILPLFRR